MMVRLSFREPGCLPHLPQSEERIPETLCVAWRRQLNVDSFTPIRYDQDMAWEQTGKMTMTRCGRF